MADPFTDTHAAIWTTLEAHNSGAASFTALVPAANRLKLTGQVQGQMHNTARVTTKPSVRIVPADVSFDAHVDSCASSLWFGWNIEARAPDERTSEDLYPLMWAILRALASGFSATGTIRSLTWNDETYNRACRLTRSRQDWGTDKPDGTVNRWLCLWRFEVLMEFATADLPPS